MFVRSILAISAVSLCCGCSPPYQDVGIPFVVEFDGQPTGCAAVQSQPVLSDLRFYVSAPATIDEDRSIAIELIADGIWQQADLALLDLEDGSGSCVNGTAEMNTALRVRVPRGATTGLAFTVGVPFDRNHADPLTADAPLGDAAMHWHWRSGYKFLRGGMTSEDAGFWIHLGSTACKGTVRNITGCDRPNRTTVKLADFELFEDTVVVDMSALLAAVDLGDNTPGDCSSGPAETTCEGPFAALGIEFATGANMEAQQVFKRRVGR